jgi:hypothetical protein
MTFHFSDGREAFISQRSQEIETEAARLISEKNYKLIMENHTNPERTSLRVENQAGTVISSRDLNMEETVMDTADAVIVQAYGKTFPPG